ncbi:hypothetical protein [Algoriphagus namhaensis]
MDLGNIIYILAVIAYFIYSATQSNKKKKQAEQNADSLPPEETPDRGVTFEDLLREIREAQSPKKQPEPKPEKPQPVAQQRVEQVRPTPKPQPVRTKRYEEADDEIQYYEDAYERMEREEERLAKVAASIPSQKPIAHTTKKKKVNPYAEKLKNQRSVREAIVLGEILNRKHF